MIKIKKKGKIMDQKIYITDAERQKCRKVANAFAELENEAVDLVVADTGRFGFVRLTYFNELYGFGKSSCYTDSKELFDALWNDWLNEQLFKIALNDPALMDLEYEDIYRSLTAEKRRELMGKRSFFAEKSGITDA